MRTWLLSSLAVVGSGIAAAGVTSPAHAGDLHVGIGIGFPAPVIVEPPRYYSPPVRYYAPPVRYYGPRYYGHDHYRHEEWSRHREGERHHDGDRYHGRDHR
ncbi:MAG TPA: hypothetical protein VGM84_23520 [Steroidobacteraceae bacterium]